MFAQEAVFAMGEQNIRIYALFCLHSYSVKNRYNLILIVWPDGIVY